MAFTAITTSDGPDVSAFSSILESVSASTLAQTTLSESTGSAHTSSPNNGPTTSSIPPPNSNPRQAPAVPTHPPATNLTGSPTSPSPHQQRPSPGPFTAAVVGCIAGALLLFLPVLFLIRRHRVRKLQPNFEIMNGKNDAMLGRHPAFDSEEAVVPPIRFKSLNGQMIRVRDDEEKPEMEQRSSPVRRERVGTGFSCERYG